VKLDVIDRQMPTMENFVINVNPGKNLYYVVLSHVQIARLGFMEMNTGLHVKIVFQVFTGLLPQTVVYNVMTVQLGIFKISKRKLHVCRVYQENFKTVKENHSVNFVNLEHLPNLSIPLNVLFHN
jgi:hypothetical protein